MICSKQKSPIRVLMRDFCVIYKALVNSRPERRTYKRDTNDGNGTLVSYISMFYIHLIINDNTNQ